jgi:hypothetical protein
VVLGRPHLRLRNPWRSVPGLVRRCRWFRLGAQRRRVKGGNGCHTEAVRQSAGPFDPDRAYVYGPQDRREQLGRFMTACHHIGSAVDAGAWPVSHGYLELAKRAQRPIASRGEVTSIDLLGSGLPPKPSWMDPRMAELQPTPETAKQDEAAAAHHHADHAALELRAWGQIPTIHPIGHTACRRLTQMTEGTGSTACTLPRSNTGFFVSEGGIELTDSAFRLLRRRSHHQAGSGN